MKGEENWRRLHRLIDDYSETYYELNRLDIELNKHSVTPIVRNRLVKAIKKRRHDYLPYGHVAYLLENHHGELHIVARRLGKTHTEVAADVVRRAGIKEKQSLPLHAPELEL